MYNANEEEDSLKQKKSKWASADVILPLVQGEVQGFRPRSANRFSPGKGRSEVLSKGVYARVKIWGVHTGSERACDK